MTDQQSLRDDYKLIIFGWITTVLGIPEKGNLDKYNELTDRLYDFFIQYGTSERLDELKSITGFSEARGVVTLAGTTWPDGKPQKISDRIDFLKQQVSPTGDKK